MNYRYLLNEPYAPELESLKRTYERHRNVIISADVEVDHDLTRLRRMTLGFDKCLRLVQAASIHDDSLVLNIFAGAGGVLRLACLFHPRLLVGVDRLYHHPRNTTEHVRLHADSQVQAWISEVQQNPGIPESVRSAVTWPLLAQGNVFDVWLVFHRLFDVIIIDPPFGWASHDLLGGRTPEEIFVASLFRACDALRPGGIMLTVVPTTWLTHDRLIDVLRTGDPLDDLESSVITLVQFRDPVDKLHEALERLVETQR